MLTSLEPGKYYRFDYGNKREGETLWAGDDGSFTLPPLPGDGKPFHFVVVGDMGADRPYCEHCTLDFEDNKVYQTMCGGAARGAPFVVDSIFRKLQSSPEPMVMAHIGDLAYACTVEAKWDYWMHTINPLSAHMPYMVSVGNHEYGYRTGAARDPSGAAEPYRPIVVPGDVFDNDSFGECGVPTASRFHMPQNGNSVFWYSFKAGLVHTIVLSMEHDVRKGTEQRTWLEQELASVDRVRTPWLIVTSHRPLYCSEKSAAGDYKVGLLLARELDDLFISNKVNVYLAGHYHAYERTCPMAHGACQGSPSSPSAPVHITVGTGGIDFDQGHWDAPWSTLHVDPAYGYGYFSVQGRDALRWRYVNVTVDGREEILDDVWIHQWQQGMVV